MSLPVAARNGSLWPGVTLERAVLFSDEISRIGFIQHIGQQSLRAVQFTQSAGDQKRWEMRHFSSLRSIADESRLCFTSKFRSGNGVYCNQDFILDVRSPSLPRGKQYHTVLLAQCSQSN